VNEKERIKTMAYKFFNYVKYVTCRRIIIGNVRIKVTEAQCCKLSLVAY
jgi:hypothetical protein